VTEAGHAKAKALLLAAAGTVALAALQAWARAHQPEGHAAPISNDEYRAYRRALYNGESPPVGPGQAGWAQWWADNAERLRPYRYRPPST
jgi:hypothetical protein